MSLPPWVLILMWLPTLGLLTAVWFLLSPWLAVAGLVVVAALDARVLVREWRKRRAGLATKD